MGQERGNETVVPIVGGVKTETVTIAVGQQLSDGVRLGDRRLLGVIVPADTEGSNLTFEMSADGTSYFDVYGVGSALSYSFGDPCYVPVEPEKFLGCEWLKVDTGTNQTSAAATLTLVLG